MRTKLGFLFYSSHGRGLFRQNAVAGGNAMRTNAGFARRLASYSREPGPVMRTVPRSGRWRTQGRDIRRSPGFIRPSSVAWLAF